jgi:acyl-CoA thioesterase FadM
MRVTIGRLGTSSIRYDYQFLTDDGQPELAAEGSMTVVVVKDGRSIDIPPEWRAALSGSPLARD